MSNANRESGENVIIPGFRHAYTTKASDCLVVCAGMVLNYYGVAYAVPDTALPLELASLSNSLNSGTPVDNEGHVVFSAILELTPEDIEAHLVSRRPVIIAYRPSRGDEYHGVVITGIDEVHQRFFVNDPARRRPGWKKISQFAAQANSNKHLVMLIGLCES
jgi:hypothetical protein